MPIVITHHHVLQIYTNFIYWQCKTRLDYKGNNYITLVVFSQNKQLFVFGYG